MSVCDTSIFDQQWVGLMRVASTVWRLSAGDLPKQLDFLLNQWDLGVPAIKTHRAVKESMARCLEEQGKARTGGRRIKSCCKILLTHEEIGLNVHCQGMQQRWRLLQANVLACSMAKQSLALRTEEKGTHIAQSPGDWLQSAWLEHAAVPASASGKSFCLPVLWPFGCGGH